MSRPDSNAGQGGIEFLLLAESEPPSSPAPSVADTERAVTAIIRTLEGFSLAQVEDVLERAGSVARRRAGFGPAPSHIYKAKGQDPPMSRTKPRRTAATTSHPDPKDDAVDVAAPDTPTEAVVDDGSQGVDFMTLLPADWDAPSPNWKPDTSTVSLNELIAEMDGEHANTPDLEPRMSAAEVVAESERMYEILVGRYYPRHLRPKK